METVTHAVRASGGDLIRVEDAGPADGKPVLVHPGSPGSRRLYRPHVRLAARQFGLRLLSWDRPGYGGRPRRAGRRVADAVTDVRSVADALGLDRLTVWGASGGGSHALACAALLPDLVAGAAVFASFAPYGSPGLDFCGDWPEEYRREVRLFFTDRPAARRRWHQDSERLRDGCSSPEGWLARWGAAAGTDDAHSREMACHLAAVTRDALRGAESSRADGTGRADGGDVDGDRRGDGGHDAHHRFDDGYWDDWVATLTPWGFSPTAIEVPVRLWHGVRDRAVPVSNGRWLAEHIPGVVAHFGEHEDHTDVEDNHREAAYGWLSGLL